MWFHDACVHLLREITIMWCVYNLLSYLKWPKHILQCMIKKNDKHVCDFPPLV